MDDWRIAAELALRLGADFDLEHRRRGQDEIARVAPAFAGVDAELLRRARDGVVLPLADHRDEIVLRTAWLAISAGVSWEPIPPTPAIAAEPSDGAAERPTSEPSRRGCDAAGTPAAAVAAAPAADLVQWDRDAKAPARCRPTRTALRLVAARTLYDGGRIAASSRRRSSALAPGAALVVHPNDLARIGVAPTATPCGSRARAAPSTLPVRADAAVARRAPCFMPFAQSDTSVPTDLIDVTDVGHRPARGDARGETVG